jgi:hypothetical protein
VPPPPIQPPVHQQLKAAPLPMVRPEATSEDEAAARMAADAADAALGVATAPSKAAIFVHDEKLRPILLSERIVALAQIECGSEARIKLNAKRRNHLTTNAVDECALDRSIVTLLSLMRAQSERVDVEIRWLLKSPALEPKELLRCWQEAVDALSVLFPLQRLQVELQPDESCVKLSMLSDGWEEWTEKGGAVGAVDVAAPFVVAWLLSHVRYRPAVPRLFFTPLQSQQAAALVENPALLRAFCSRSSTLVIIVKRAGSPHLLCCGARPFVRQARSLLHQWMQR